MSRSAADATRFTATSPHAYSKPPSTTFTPTSPSSRSPRSTIPLPHTSPNRSSIPVGGEESPQEKVARLRQAARAAREAKVSRFDRVVARGRVWADRAHRVTALSLIAATGVAGAITVLALGDMIIYNRRKRRDYFAEQSALHKTRLAEAKEAAAKGVADEDQVLLINRERAAFEAEKARLAKKGIFRRTKDWMLGGLKTDEEVAGGLRPETEGTVNATAEPTNVAAVEQTTHVTEGQDGRPLLGRGDREESKSQILRAVDAKRREGERVLQSQGAEEGPLDRLAADTTTVAQSSSPRGGWTSWVTGR